MRGRSPGGGRGSGRRKEGAYAGAETAGADARVATPPVISPPSRQDLGVDKVKKHLATSQPGHVRPPSGQDGGYGGAQGPVLTLLPPNMRFSSPPGPGTSISYQLPRPAPAIFNPQIIRPLSVLPLPGQYPFIMNWNQIALPQIPISQITSLLPVVPDSGD